MYFSAVPFSSSKENPLVTHYMKYTLMSYKLVKTDYPNIDLCYSEIEIMIYVYSKSLITRFLFE